MKNYSQICFVFILLFFVSVSSGAIIEFDMLSGGDIGPVDDQPQGTINKDGLEMTLIANDGVLNGTASSFGINAQLTGDDTDELDAGSGEQEILTLRFDQDIMLVSIDFVSLGGGDSAQLYSSNNGIDMTISSSDSTNPFMIGTTVLANTDVDLNHLSGVFGIESITVETVPEPAIATLVLSAGFMLFRRRRSLSSNYKPGCQR